MTLNLVGRRGRPRRRLRRSATALSVALCLAAAACAGGGYGGGAGQEGGGGNGFPSRDLTLIAAGHPGGGLDTHARMLADAIKENDLAGVNVTVANIGGGGGNPARASLLERPNDGHTVVVESNRIFLAPLTGTTDMQLDAFQPVGKLSVDYLVWAVRADSSYESAEQVLEAASGDPESVSFGVGTVPSDDQLNILEAAKAHGVDDLRALNVVAFESGGDLLTQLLGGHVDVISTGLSEVAEQAEAGEVRLLAISAETPQGGTAEGVPTWTELGLDYSLDHWRGVFGPSGMPENAVTWWSDTIRQATQTDAWQQQITKLQLSTDFEPPEEYLDSTILPQQRSYQELLREVGLLSE